MTPPVRLTVAEWRAVIGAFTDADSVAEDDLNDENPDAVRDQRVRERALAKIRATMTTPSIRDRAFP